MDKVITINLNGNAYNFEEPGYEALKMYLDRASTALAENPDKTEIVADLEQAIADKCAAFLNPNKTVITHMETERMIGEMGPVDESANKDGERKEEPRKSDEEKEKTPKRLYKIREGAGIAGVCRGIAAYFDIDVTIVRVVFILLGFLTRGGWILVYFVMAMVVPYANTGEEKAAARGIPFNAQELIDRARQEYAKFRDKKDWRKWKREMKRTVRENMREWRWRGRERWMESRPYVAHVWSGFGTAILGVFIALASVAWIYVLFSLVTKHAVFGWAVPASIPLWIAIIGIFCVYEFVLAPVKMAFHAVRRSGDGQRHSDRHGTGNGIAWIGVFVILGWLAYAHIPQAHALFNRIFFKLEDLVRSFRKN